jgi:Tryptophan halogenase
MMIGDAACFLDPLLSTGTHPAMFSALIGAAVITAALDGAVSEQEALSFFERQYRRAYPRLLKLVSLMYQQYQGKETYFWLAQRLVRDGVRYRLPIGPFSRIISGLSDLQDAGYSPGWVSLNHKTAVAEGGSGGPVVRGLQDSGTGLRLVTAPRIGLERLGSPVSSTLSTR